MNESHVMNFDYMLYASDSGRKWKKEMEILMNCNCDHRVYQLLTHPFLYTENKMEFDEWYDSFFAHEIKKMIDYKEEWRQLWK